MIKFTIKGKKYKLRPWAEYTLYLIIIIAIFAILYIGIASFNNEAKGHYVLNSDPNSKIHYEWVEE